MLIDQYLAQPSSEKPPPAVDGNKHRDPQLDISERQTLEQLVRPWNSWTDTALKEISASNPFPQSSGNSKEEEVERIGKKE